MSLSGLYELSSELRTDDLEKEELEKKKVACELAIKQEEKRVSAY
jgi:hypothetical protein